MNIIFYYYIVNSANKMNKLINLLPIELIYHILSYSYNPQPIHLQKDIISYVKTKRVIHKIFYRRYLPLDKSTINYHFTFHIHCFLTGMPNTYGTCENKRAHVCNRIFMHHKIKSNPQLTYCVFWGLLTPEERDQFVEIQKKMDFTQMP